MTPSYKGFTRKEEQRLRFLVSKACDYTPWWVNEIIIQKTKGDNGMRCEPSREYRRMNVQIQEGSLIEDDMTLYRYMCHEIAHCYNEPLLDMIAGDMVSSFIKDDDMLEVFRLMFMRRIEEQTEDLGILFASSGGIEFE